MTLNDRPGEPMDLAVLPDGSVLHTTREGTIWLNDAKTGVNSQAGTLDVYRHDEEGLQSIALQPGFDGKKKNWVYLYYSPPQNTPEDDPATPDDWRINKQFQMMKFDGQRWVLFGPILTDEFKTN